ncbi:MAG: Rrf2 family transcriptional regulator [Deltaproteobacteria bacterium]|nr:Rrf2 family transcriptional regulator [Deltaproteobacteria bacterium]
MIQLRKDTDQALLILTSLLKQKEGVLVSASAVAENLALPYPTVSKILKALHKYGLLNSVQGPKGGYTVTKACLQMSVGSVIEKIEGPIALTLCTSPHKQTCVSKDSCGIHPHMSVINRMVRGVLMQLPLQALIVPLKKAPKNEDIQAFWQQYFSMESNNFNEAIPR